MKKVLLGYVSRTGNTEKMAEYIAEGLRMTGNTVAIKKISELKDAASLEGYDAYIFGSPTYHLEPIQSMKTFLFLLEKVEVEGKLAGSFGSFTHSGNAPKIILDTMEYVFKMKASSLGAFNLLEHKVEAPDGIRGCQDYGKAFGEQIL